MAVKSREYKESVTHFMFFIHNFPRNWMDAFKDEPEWMQDHIKSKWTSAWSGNGPSYGMLKFFMDLDFDRRELLLDWVRVNYKGHKMNKYEPSEEEINRE